MIYLVNNKDFMDKIESRFGGDSLMLDKDTNHLFRYKVKDNDDIIYMNKKFFIDDDKGLRA